MIKLAWCDVDTLNNGGVAYAMYIEGGKPVNIQVVKDKDGIIKRVIRNGSLNPISHIYLQGATNDCQMLRKELSKKVIDNGGGKVSIELSGGLDNNKQPLPPRIVEVEYTYNEAYGLPKTDPRAYDDKIVKDGTTARLEGEFTL